MLTFWPPGTRRSRRDEMVWACSRSHPGKARANSSPPQRAMTSPVRSSARMAVTRSRNYVAGGMAVGVVVVLEVVHVEQGDGERVAGTAGASQLAVNLLLPAATVCG